MRKEFIVGVVLIIITGLFAKYKLFDDKTELKYSLSQKINSDFLTNKEEFGIQQLTLKNSGDLVVNDIVIKINSNILDFKIKKFTTKDSVTTTNLNSNFELNYPKLPPMGELIVLIKSSGINNDNVDIYHSKGKATEIFESKSNFESNAFYVLVAIYLMITVFSFRTTFIDSLKSKAIYVSEKILKMKQPWYVDKNKWSEIRNIAVNNHFKNDLYSKIEKSSYYMFLNKKEDENLTEDEKSKLKEIALTLLTKKIGDVLSGSYFTYDLAQFKSLNKPNNVSSLKWEEISKSISKVTLAKILRDLFESNLDIYDERKVLKILENNKPPLLTEEDWANLKETVNNYYLAIVLTEIVKNGDCFGKVKWELINEKNTKKLREIFDIIKESKKNTEYNSELLYTMRTSFDWINIPEKPEILIEEDWSRIEVLFNTVIQHKIDAEEDLKKASKIRDEFYPLKVKISKQLIIINDLLNDPNSIETIESYNIPFEKGNWENLLQISDVLKKKLKAH